MTQASTIILRGFRFFSPTNLDLNVFDDVFNVFPFALGHHFSGSRSRGVSHTAEVVEAEAAAPEGPDTKALCQGVAKALRRAKRCTEAPIKSDLGFAHTGSGGTMTDIWVFPNIGVPPNIHFNGIFHYKPSILGYPYFWKHPYYNQNGETPENRRLKYVRWEM